MRRQPPKLARLNLLLASGVTTLTVSLPAVSPDGQRGDSIAGDPGGGGCDLHLDAACTLLIVALQRCTVE